MMAQSWVPEVFPTIIEGSETEDIAFRMVVIVNASCGDDVIIWLKQETQSWIDVNDQRSLESKHDDNHQLRDPVSDTFKPEIVLVSGSWLGVNKPMEKGRVEIKFSEGSGWETPNTPSINSSKELIWRLLSHSFLETAPDQIKSPGYPLQMNEWSSSRSITQKNHTL